MEITKRIKNIAVAGLAAGTIAVAGLGIAGTAHADEPKVGQVVVEDGMGGSKVIGTATVYGGNHVVYNNPVANQPVYVWQNLNRPATYYYNYNPYPVYGYPYNYMVNYSASITQANQVLLVGNAAEVLNITPRTVINGLTAGKSLTQIAAERGWNRAAFLSALNSHIQADNSVYSSQTIAQSSYFVDVAGLGIVYGSANWASLWSTFAY